MVPADGQDETPAGTDDDAPAAAEQAARERSAEIQRVAKRSRVAATKARYTHVVERANATTGGQITRRMRELDVANHALILASLSLTLLIPALVSVSSVVSLGSPGGIAESVIIRLGLTGEAAHEVQRLFPKPGTVAGGTTAFSAVTTLFWAVGWPAELQRGYQTIWSLPARGIRDIWRPMLWLLSLFAALVALVNVARLIHGTGGQILTTVVGLPEIFAWTWWTQHLLLGGRVGWRPLLPGAIATTIGLLGFRIAMSLYVPHALTSEYRQYGPIGIVLVLLYWLIGFSTVMLGGPLAGHTIAMRRAERRRAAAVEAAESAAGSAASTAAASLENGQLPGPPDRLVPP